MSDGVVRQGQRLNKQAGIIEPFTEQMVDDATLATMLGEPLVEAIPHDYNATLVRTYEDLSDLYEAVAPVKVPGTVTMSKAQLPDTLVSVAVGFNFTELAGEDVSDEPLVEVSGSNGDITISATAAAQAGASVSPYIQPIVKEAPAGVPLVCTHVFFYMTGNFTRNDVLTRLAAADIFNTSVSNWPLFRPVSQTLTLSGQQVSVRANATSRQHGGYTSEGGYSWQLQPGNDSGNDMGAGTHTGNRSDGFSKEGGLSTQLVTLPPTINALITLSSTSLAKTATVSVNANMRELVFTSAALAGVIAITNEPAARTATATGKISPATIPATNVTAIPSSGLYLVELSTQFAEAGISYVHSVVIDAVLFA